MPKHKQTHGRPKTISCPRCGKKICFKTNVLQHMNQPTGICFAASWAISNRSLYQFHPDESFRGHDPSFEAHQSPSLVDQPSPSPPCSESLPPHNYDPSVNAPEDVEMDMPDHFDNESQDQQNFMEAYQGCGEAFLGGSTFMDLFWQDEHAEERRTNLYFPFASCDEWDFASWCLRSGLSMAAIDSLLSLNVVWTCAVRVCCIYEDWLSGDSAWAMQLQDQIPKGGTMFGVVLSSDKTNISVISGNWMVYPLLISLANIDPVIHSKISLHTYFLLALLPITKFTHKQSCICSLLQDRLTHATLNKVLEPLKVAARMGYMMSDPVGNLRYCYTPLVGYIADTPEQTLLACVGPKASLFTTATSKQALSLNGVVEPFWDGWPLSCPSLFLHIETLHHFHRFAWDHDDKWCIEVVTPPELDFVGYRTFNDGISKLKQVTGRDHRTVQRYIVGVIAGAVPPRFLIAIRALLDFRYLAQAPVFSDQSLDKLTEALQVFHDNKDAVVQAGGWKKSSKWEIPKLELLQSVVSNIRHSGPVWQWSADATEHAHIQEIKNPARMGNNQNYYDQIARYLDRSDKCFRFNLATYFETRGTKAATLESDDDFTQGGEDHDDVDDVPSHG
ncbi:hypothetical protein JVT61DRAFT_7920 [Boletus reticuloceps]|uniref:C2H2-type domain-containing protein n=1 Tax=Boletus reticuloceps TaxID=495285 RepID=A0A8I2YHP5_9AGAM|nr:hypothetical protein JVT61DRAFT_7920 [Boletus reticuloceps]